MERGPRGEAVAQTSRHLPPTGIPDPPHGRGPSRTSFLVQSALGLLPVWSRGGNGRPERSERSTDLKRAERPRQLPRRSARHRSRHAGFAAGGGWFTAPQRVKGLSIYGMYTAFVEAKSDDLLKWLVSGKTDWAHPVIP
ncbi:hypothetical protein NDU88_000612 [Pleurodeles waltl]|uniref:Uncharacterized protein n=1 Tax=Pleurodeles waltl TaxID=8319 RepID=A0AAV7KR81_PLEWA|nr:hypothetical protein NDU88_000612 [Pleurodeles waltl]